MSNTAINWAKKQQLRSSLKNLLLILADHANNFNWCWPSHKSLRKSTGLNPKTIMRGLAALQCLGLISDTGERAGPTKRVKVYVLNLEVAVSEKKGAMGDTFQSSHFGTSKVPKTSLDSPTFSGQQSQNRDTEPKPNPHRISIEPSRRKNLDATQGDWYFIPTDETHDRLLSIAPGWDRQGLYAKYREYSKSREKPRSPQAAFLGWAVKFTKGKRPGEDYQSQYREKL